MKHLLCFGWLHNVFMNSYIEPTVDLPGQTAFYIVTFRLQERAHKVLQVLYICRDDLTGCWTRFGYLQDSIRWGSVPPSEGMIAIYLFLKRIKPRRLHTFSGNDKECRCFTTTHPPSECTDLFRIFFYTNCSRNGSQRTIAFLK